MRKVFFKKWIPTVYENGRQVEGTGRFESKFENAGFFHQWGNAYEEFETGAGNYTFAIVELPDGTIESVLPQNIQFIDTMKQIQKL